MPSVLHVLNIGPSSALLAILWPVRLRYSCASVVICTASKFTLVQHYTGDVLNTKASRQLLTLLMVFAEGGTTLGYPMGVKFFSIFFLTCSGIGFIIAICCAYCFITQGRQSKANELLRDELENTGDIQPVGTATLEHTQGAGPSAVPAHEHIV